MPTLSIVVQGRVQGVGYRAHAARAASQFGVAGEVWNRRDGAVEIIAHHPNQEDLDRFVGALRNGPGYVDKIWMDASDQVPPGSGFEIGPTR